MKTIIRLSIVTILLICTIVANAQDSTIYKIKYEKFKVKERNGKITTFSGVALVVVSGVLFLVGGSMGNKAEEAENEGNMGLWNDYVGKESTCNIAGLATGGVGVVLLIPGSINWSVGHKKVREYQIRLEDVRSGLYFSPNQLGLKLAFKF